MNNEEENVSDRLKDWFYDEEYELENPSGYRRHVLDRRIETYLDHHFDEYLEDYNVITGVDLEMYKERYDTVQQDVKNLRQFSLDMDAQVSDLEKRVKKVRKKAK